MEKIIFEKMKKYRKEVRDKDVLEMMLKDEMVKKFPNIQRVYFQDNKIEIETQKHIMQMYSWNELKKAEPLFVCTGEKMPDTAEEFMAMKSFVEDDRQQCMTAFFWLFNRYDFGYKY